MVQQAPQTRARTVYDRWMEAQGIPIYRGHFVAKPLEVELGDWQERECKAAFIQLEGQQGVSEARITEIQPGGSLPPLKMLVSEVVYVLEGQGIATVWAGEGQKRTFEWGKHSLFCLPRNCWHQLSNARGDRPARILNYNYLPVAMTTIPEPKLLFNGPYENGANLYGKDGEEFYADAKVVTPEGGGRRGQGVFWRANFIPDMSAWDKLVPFYGRGAGGHVVFIQFPGAEMSCHMSVFDPQLYKKAHKHGPGRVIVIPKGEGYSVLWKGSPFFEQLPEDEAEKVVCPWSEGTIFVPPQNWYHQHFNTGTGEARYLALGALRQFSGDPYRHQVEYPQEDAWIRNTYEAEIAKKGLKPLMPDQAYTDPKFEWDYGDDS